MHNQHFKIYRPSKYPRRRLHQLTQARGKSKRKTVVICYRIADHVKHIR